MLPRRARAEDERHRADRRRRVRRRAQRAAELLEHDRGVDHAHAGAAVLLGHEQTEHADVAQAVQTSSRPSADAVVVVLRRARTTIGALSARKRRTESRSISWSAENSKSTQAPDATELRDTNVRKLPCAAMRLQYAPEDEAFRAELDRVARSEPAVGRAVRASRSCRARTCPTGRATWQRTLFDAGWLVPGWPPELGGRNATPTSR